MPLFTLRQRLIPYLKQQLHGYYLDLFQGTCLLCGAQSHPTLDLCKDCNKDLPYLKQACVQCALPLTVNSGVCHRCRTMCLPANYRVFATFVYQFPINRLITSLKFKRRLVISTVLAELMVRSMKAVYQHRSMPTVIIPVPLHDTRLKQRGFNQALELAKPISRALSIPLSYRGCHRVQATRPQASLGIRDGTSTLENVFVVDSAFKGQGASVCLIDDAYTTGNTVMALSNALFNAGVQSIDVWCCARTP